QCWLKNCFHSQRASPSLILNSIASPLAVSCITVLGEPSAFSSTRPIPERLSKRSPALALSGLCGTIFIRRRLVNQFSGECGEYNQRFSRSSTSSKRGGN